MQSEMSSGIAIAHTLPKWGNDSGGAAVYFIDIAAVTLEIIRDGLERTSFIAAKSCPC
jgi:hypothetical protein